jgi:hypothetical protein
MLIGIVPGFLITGLFMIGTGIILSNTVSANITKFATFNILLQLVGIILLSISFYIKGAASTDAHWKAQILELEHQIAIAKTQSEKVNIKIEEKAATKTRIIRGKTKTIIKYIDRPVFVEFAKVCPLPPDVVTLHNNAIMSLRPQLEIQSND